MPEEVDALHALDMLREYESHWKAVRFYSSLISLKNHAINNMFAIDLNDAIQLLESLGFGGDIEKYNRWYENGSKCKKNGLSLFKYNKVLVRSVKSRLLYGSETNLNLLRKLDPDTCDKKEQLLITIRCFNGILNEYNIPFLDDTQNKRTLHGYRSKNIRVADPSFRRFCEEYCRI